MLWLIITLYPGWYWVTRFVDPGCWESLPERLAVSLPALLGIFYLHRNPSKFHHAETITLVSALAVMLHIFRLIHMNGQSPIFLSGCYVAFFGMSIGFMTLRSSIIYCSIVIAAGLTLLNLGVNTGTLSVLALLLTFSIIMIFSVAFRQALIRSRQEAESGMIYAAKMVTLGEMAGGIAHEINNPLFAITASAELIKRIVRSPPPGETDQQEKTPQLKLQELSEKIVQTCNRISDIIAGLRRFARNEEIQSIVPTEIGQVIHESLDLCAARIRALNIDLRVSGNTHAVVHCDSVSTSQILLNLIGNSVDALEHTKQPQIELKVVEVAERVSLEVNDNGCGIAKEIRERVMLPFFTTKEIGKGTGLGLSVSKGLATQQGGDLVLNPTDHGASFTVTFAPIGTPLVSSKLLAE